MTFEVGQIVFYKDYSKTKIREAWGQAAIVVGIVDRKLIKIRTLQFAHPENGHCVYNDDVNEFREE